MNENTFLYGGPDRDPKVEELRQRAEEEGRDPGPALS